MLPPPGPPLPPPPPPGAAIGNQPAMPAWSDTIQDPGYLLDRITLQISNVYVRPIEQIDLLVTGLRGLYTAADRAVPADLEERVRKVYDPNQAPFARILAHLRWLPQPLPLDTAVFYRLSIIGQEERAQFLTKTISKVSDSPALKDKDPVVTCCKAIAKSLDPHSKVITAEEARRRSGYEGEGSGVGLEADIKPDGSVEVTAVYPGGPAQDAGLLPGDRLTLVGDEDGDPLPAGKILDALAQGPVATLDPCAAPYCGPLTLQWNRPGSSGKAVVPRKHFIVQTVLGTSRTSNSWNWTLDERDHLAYVRVASFSRGTSAELQRVLSQLVANDIRGVVLDLRWCPGGYLDEALDTARLFLAEGLIATVRGRRGDVQEYQATAAGPFVKLPLVILVNGATSGGAELVAAALQDHQRATVIGERTIGKGSVQAALHVDIAGVGFNLTSATFHRPSGRALHRFPDSKPTDDWGVRPDVDCILSADKADLLKRQWIQQVCRPAHSTQKLELDDLDVDAQLARARELLRRLADDKARPTVASER
jgi:carboxyl-terminal processing protease